MIWGKISIFYFAAMPLLIVSIILKLGSSPCYIWFPSVIKALPWVQSIILATWQKVAPIIILLFNIKPLYFILVIISIINIFIGGWLGINQVNVQSLLAYSSIAHIGWIFITQAIRIVIVSFIYFIIYILILLPVFIIILKVSIKNFKTINNLTLIPVNIQICLILILLSLAGLPPLSGFLPKLIILFTISTYSLIITLIIVIFSFISLYFYLNLAFSVIIRLSNTLNYLILNKTIIISIVSIIILTPMIILLYAMTIFNKSQRYWNIILYSRSMISHSWYRYKGINSNWVGTTWHIPRERPNL